MSNNELNNQNEASMSQKFGSPVADAIAAIVSPIAGDLGLEIYDIEFSGGVLRIEIDTPPGQESGVSLESIALVTRLLGRELDHTDPVPGRYTLEISSPGLERNLRRESHYIREVGKTIAVRLHSAIDGTRRFQGVLLAADATTITVRVAGEGKKATSRDITLPISSIERAKTVFVWGKAPKPGSPEARKMAELESAELESAELDDDFEDDDFEDNDFEDNDTDLDDYDTANTEATAS